MNNILYYKDFLLNEAIVHLDDDLIRHLSSISTILDKEESEWIEKIISMSSEDIESKKLDDDNLYSFKLSGDNKFFDMYIKKSDDRVSKQEFKVGRALKLLTPEIPDHILGNIVAALQSKSEFGIEVVQGDDIAKYYNDFQIDPGGELASSCMNDMEDEFYEIYTENEESIKLAVLVKEGLLVARALLYKTNNGWFRDRIYFSAPKYRYVFEEWTEDKGYFTKYTLPDDSYVQLNKAEFKKYPYVDTLQFLSLTKKRLSDDMNTDFDEDEQVIQLNSTDGEFEVIQNYKRPFYNPVYSIDDYRYVNNLGEFIRLSIDSDKWTEDFINSEFDNYYTYTDDFLDSFDNFIESNFDELQLDEIDPDINEENFKEKILQFKENYGSKLEDILFKVLRYYYSEDQGFSWEEFTAHDVNMSYHGMDSQTRKYYENFIRSYCDLDTLEKNLKELYDKSYEKYEESIIKLAI